MAAERRQHPPRHRDTGPARRKAYRPLQRRLRQTVRGVEWSDVLAAVVVQTVLDALGGDEPLKALIQVLAQILDL